MRRCAIRNTSARTFARGFVRDDDALRSADGEDGALGRVDHCTELANAKHAQVGDAE